MIIKLQWCRARDLLGSQIPVTTGGFELRISFIRNRYLTHITRMQEIRSSNPPVVTIICDPNKSRARHHRSLKLGSKLKYINVIIKDLFGDENEKVCVLPIHLNFSDLFMLATGTGFESRNSSFLNEPLATKS